MDIKLSNLVYDDFFDLKLVDFDVAVQLEDKNEEIGEYRGTKSWTAPEVGERDGSMYSPIKADRWTRGCVILHLLDRAGEEDSRLRMAVGRLKSIVPQQRPIVVRLEQMARRVALRRLT
jgi:serine/threonine protein kinase